MPATSQQSSQQMISDWFQKAAEMTEAAMMATARMQLATLDRFMESMTAGRSMLESAPFQPQEWLGEFESGQREEGGEGRSEAGAQQRGRGEQAQRGGAGGQQRQQPSQPRQSSQKRQPSRQGKSATKSRSRSQAKSPKSRGRR